MAKNKIFIGPAEKNIPIKFEAPALAAINPGNILLVASGKLKKHDVNGTAAAGGFAYIADVNMLDGTTTAYAADDTVQAFRLQSGETYHALVVSGAVLAFNTPLTSDGAGRLKVATLGTDAVIAFSDETVTPAADALVRVKIA